jgi:predicted transcriptional regulator of viral defense system
MHILGESLRVSISAFQARSMKRRTLSGNEAKLVLQLEWDNVWLLDPAMIRKLLRCSKSYAYFVAHSLVKKGWLEPAGKGHYLLIEAKRGYKKLAPKMTPYVIVRTLNQPYYVAYLSAAYYHHLTTQLPRVLHIAVQRQRRPLRFKHVRVQFVTVTKKKFFGYEKARIDNEEVVVSDLEKTLIDSLDRPELVGGIEAVARFIHIASPRTDFKKLLFYTKQNGRRALSVRLGYLLETLGVSKNSKSLLLALKKDASHLVTPLGEMSRWGRSGHINSDWNVIENVPIQNLLAEVEIA